MHSEAFHFWSGPEGVPTEYENYAESTTGKGGAGGVDDVPEAGSAKSVDEAKTFSDAAALQKVADTGNTVFTLPVSN